MHIYQCHITLMEATYFSSREVSKVYFTEPLLGNYALAYALGLVHGPYHNDKRVLYQEHLVPLNERGIYVTPGTFITEPRFLLRRFNVQPDAYRSLYGQGFIAVPPPHGRLQLKGTKWEGVEAGQAPIKYNPNNRPQEGRLRLLASGNQARCYVTSTEPLQLPRYIRLGKFMSKARVDVREVSYEVVQHDTQTIDYLLNPADLSPMSKLYAFDMVNVPPTPLIRQAQIEGAFYRLTIEGQTQYLPYGCVFQFAT